MSIEKAAPCDFEVLAALWEASVRATHDFLCEADINYFRTAVEQEYLYHVDVYALKREAGDFSGFIGIAGDKIEMLFIHPDDFGKGYGARLMRFAVDDLGATKVDVNEQNTAATGFYLSKGFRVVGRSETDGLGKPFPLLHMELHTK
ncbi:GNAT family N-acetyltransferase [Maridesulfovibrio sp. FT414]